MDLINKWIDWNEKKISSHDFCMAFEMVFRKEIQKRWEHKQLLIKKIKRQMVRNDQTTRF